jgi:hypothetical protein
MNKCWRALTPFGDGLFDTNRDRHAKAGHPIQDRAPDFRLRLLIGQSPGMKSSPNNGLVAKHRRFNQAPSAIARTAWFKSGLHGLPV